MRGVLWVCLVLLAGCGQELIDPLSFFQEIDQAQPEADSGAHGYRLAYKRHQGTVEVYQGTFSLRQSGHSHRSTDTEFLLQNLILKSTSQGDFLAILKRNTKRYHEYTDAEGQTITQNEPNEYPVILGANQHYFGHLRTYYFSPGGELAYQVNQLTKEPRPHALEWEEVHYYFPVLPWQEPVRVGEKWSARVPVVVPLRVRTLQRVYPTWFWLEARFVLLSVTEREGNLLARIKYRFYGKFDSRAQEYKSRFSPEFDAKNQIIHELSGEGDCRFDVTRGKLMFKDEQARLLVRVISEVGPTATDPDVKTVTIEILRDSEQQLRILEPGTVGPGGKIVPKW